MTFRDTSADTTLDNANEGIMRQAEMMEENNRQYVAGLEEQLRQANKEIEKLKAEIERLREIETLFEYLKKIFQLNLRRNSEESGDT